MQSTLLHRSCLNFISNVEFKALKLDLGLDFFKSKAGPSAAVDEQEVGTIEIDVEIDASVHACDDLSEIPDKYVRQSD